MFNRRMGRCDAKIRTRWFWRRCRQPATVAHRGRWYCQPHAAILRQFTHD